MSLSYRSKLQILQTLFYGELNWSRLIMAASAIVWGVLLFIEQDVITRPGLRIMAEQMSHCVWGGIFLTSGFLQFYILVKKKFNSKLSLIFDGANAVLWCFTIISVIMSDFPPSATISTEIVIMLLSCWIFMRSGSEKKLRIEDATRNKHN